MHVMMISLDASMLGDPHGNTVQRHLEYARRIGQLTVVTYNSSAQPKTVQRFAENFVVYPTNTRPVLFPWKAYRIAAHVQRTTPADVVSTQDPFAAGLVGVLLKRRFGMALEMQSHSHFFENPDWLAERPLRNRMLYALAKRIITYADVNRLLTVREKAIYVKHGVPADHITVLPSPTHVDHFAQPVPDTALSELRNTLGIAAYVPVLLWVGFPAEFKHVELLLAAYEHLHVLQPTAQLVIVGDFTSRPQFVARAKAAGVIFAGRIEHTVLPMYYQMADIYMHTSRYEGVPRVLIEALASGTPVVATDHLGANAVVQPGVSGILTPHTPEALAQAANELILAPERRQAMGVTGQQDVLERFHYDRQLEAIVDSYRLAFQVHQQTLGKR